MTYDNATIKVLPPYSQMTKEQKAEALANILTNHWRRVNIGNIEMDPFETHEVWVKQTQKPIKFNLEETCGK